MSARDGVLDAAAIAELRDRHYGEGSIPEHHSAHPCDACRLLLTFASRPAADPAGLDVAALAAAIMRHAESHKAHSRTHVQVQCAGAIAAEYARLADGPGPA